MTNLTANILTFSNYHTITLNKTNDSMVKDTDILTYSISNIGADKSLSVSFTLYPNTLSYPYKLYIPSGANITFTDLGKFKLTDNNGNNIEKDVAITPSSDTSFGIEFVSSVTFTINPTPSDAVVTMTANGITQTGNSIELSLSDNPLYAWSNDTLTYYTENETLNVGDVIYDETKTPTEYVVKSINGTTIEIG